MVFLKACFRIVFLPHAIHSFVSNAAQFIGCNAQGLNEHLSSRESINSLCIRMDALKLLSVECFDNNEAFYVIKIENIFHEMLL